MIEIKVNCDECLKSITENPVVVQFGQDDFHFCSSDCLELFIVKGGFKDYENTISED